MLLIHLTAPVRLSTLRLFTKSILNKCYIGGNYTINGQEIITNYVNERRNALSVAPTFSYGVILTDCHNSLNFLNTYGVQQDKLVHNLLTFNGVHTRVFANGKLQGYTAISTDNSTNTDVFGVQGQVSPVTPIKTGVTILTQEQSQIAANYTNFDFVNVWQQSSDGTPKLRVTEYELANVIPIVLSTANALQVSLSAFDVSVSLIQPIPVRRNF